MLKCAQCGSSIEALAVFCGMCGASVRDDKFGRKIASSYTLGERIGASAQAIVYRAETERAGTKRKLAIKLLANEASKQPDVVERFRREGQLLCQLRSPHSVTTYDFGQDPTGLLYIAMELVAGIPLGQIIRASAPMPWKRALTILQGVCDALAEAHSLGIVHRDLRPENIVVEARSSNPDFAKVIGFGLAKVFAESTSLTPVRENASAVAYTAPEALRAGPIDGRSDLYALGVLAYVMITGRHPFAEARSYGDLIAAHARAKPPEMTALVPDLPRDVEALVMCCLEKDPNRRYSDATALAGSIGVLLTMAALGPSQNDTVRAPDLGEEETSVAPIPPRR